MSNSQESRTEMTTEIRLTRACVWMGLVSDFEKTLFQSGKGWDQMGDMEV